MLDNVPGAGADHDWAQVLALTAELFYDGQAGMSAYRTLGAALLRAELYEEAIAALKKAEDAVSGEQTKTASEYNWYLLAVAHANLGNFSEARAYFDRTQPLNETQPNTNAQQAPWFRRTTLRTLRRECEHLITGDDRSAVNSNAPRGRIVSRVAYGSVPVRSICSLTSQSCTSCVQECFSS